LLRPLRKEVVCEANRQFAIAMQFVHYAIVVGVVLKSASGVDGAGDTEAVELAEEEPGGIKLIFAGKLWPFGESGIENVGVGLGDEKARGISVAIALNLTSRESRSVLVVAHRAQRRCVQYYAVIQMHYEDRCVWGNSVDLIERRHAAFGKLKFSPAS